jgi:hypothetical protein
MAGTRTQVELTPFFRASRAIATGTNDVDAMSNIATNQLTDRAECFCMDTLSFYQYQQDSVLAADGVNVIAPLDGGPGRWILQSGASGSGGIAQSVEQPSDLALPPVPQGNTTTNAGQGTLVMVRSVGTLYTLVTQTTVIAAILAAHAADGQTIVTTSTGALYVQLDLLKGYQTTYHVDETNGDNANYGLLTFVAAAAAGNALYGPVADVDEVMRRINVSRRTANTALTIQFDTTSDYTKGVDIDYNAFDPTNVTSQTILNLRGPARTVTTSGALTSVVADAGTAEIEIASSIALTVGQLIQFTSGPANGLYAWVAATTTTGYRLSPLVQPIAPVTSMENNFYDITRAANPAIGNTFNVLSVAKKLTGGIAVTNENCNVNVVDLDITGFVISPGYSFFVRCQMRDDPANNSVFSILQSGAECAFNDCWQEFSGGTSGAIQPECHGRISMNGGLCTGKVGWETGAGCVLRVNSDWLLQGNQAIVVGYSLMLGRAGVLIIQTKSTLTTVQPNLYVHAVGTAFQKLAAGVIIYGFGPTGGVVGGGRDVLGAGDGIIRGFVITGACQALQGSATKPPVITCTTAEMILGGKTFPPGEGFAEIPATNGVDTPSISVSAAGVADAGRIHAISSTITHVGGTGIYTLTLNDAVPATLAQTKVEAVAQDNAHWAAATLTSTTTVEVRTYDTTGTLADAAFYLTVRDRPNLAGQTLLQ